MLRVTTLSFFWIFECIPRVQKFGLYNEPRNCIKIVETYLKRSELSASNAMYLTLFCITDSERKEIYILVVTVEL